MPWVTNFLEKSRCAKVTFLSLTIFSFCLAFGVNRINAQAIDEGFENVAGLPAAGWLSVNHSSPLGTSNWSQCSGTAIPPAQGGTSNSCILVNFNSTTGTGTISNWLVAPNVTFNNGDTVSFYTRTPNNSFPDRLQLRLSTNGASTNVGTTATDVGDFSTLLVDINPTYTPTYPTTWTQFTVTISGLSGPTSGRVAFRYFVENGGPNGTNSNIIGVDTFSYTPAAGPTGPATVDFNGDGKTDFAVTRNIGGGPTGQLRWFINLNGTGTTNAADWGVNGDDLTPGDFDGDGNADIAVWRPFSSGQPSGNAFFYILQSGTNTLRTEDFGQMGDDPSVIGDYDGDGTTDVAVFREGATSGDPSIWYYRGSMNNPSGNITFFQWGSSGDFPAPGDYDGDGKNDFVIQRNNGGGQAIFWKNLTTDGVSTQVFGTPTDVIVPGDYDGDGKTDIAVIRGGGGTIHWFVLPSTGGAFTETIFGASATDFPTQGDYDGDGKTDFGVWRQTDGNFWYLGSTSGTQSIQLGANGDTPVNNYNTH
ncbi:MAG: choice-of-anchor J domain-containing protein [Pyrinomonadaceae bacterium]